MKHFFQDINGWSQQEDQGELIRMIIHELRPPLSICEVGIYKGRMTAMWTVELLNAGIPFTYMAVDHFDGRASASLDDDYYEETMKNLAPVLDYVSVIRSTSIDEAARHACEFDVVYIDAGHDYDSVKADIGAWLPKVRKGGIICGDDYISGWDGVIRAVDEAFGKVERIGNQQWYVRL